MFAIKMWTSREDFYLYTKTSIGFRRQRIDNIFLLIPYANSSFTRSLLMSALMTVSVDI